MMKTFNTFRIKLTLGDFYWSLSSIHGSNPEIVGGNNNLRRDLPERMSLINL